MTRTLKLLWIAGVCATASPALADAALVSFSGKVEIGSGAPTVWRAAKPGDSVRNGESIRTGAESRAELRLGDQRIARVYPASVLRVGAASDAGVKSVELDAGASIFDFVKQRMIADEFDVHTREITVSVKGTRFLVEALAGPDQASVFRGEVVLAGEGFDSIAVRSGFTGVGGDVFATPFGDPWDAWASGASAPELIASALQDRELRDAVETARDSLKTRGAPPAKIDEVDLELKSGRGGRDGGPDAVGDSVEDHAPPADGGPALDADARIELDGVSDVARDEVRDGDGTSSALLDAVLGGDSDDFPGAGSAGGNGGPGNGFANGPNGSTTSFPFTFDVQTSGGPNTVTVGFGSASVTLDQNDIDDVVRGNRTPYAAFDSLLDQLNVDPVQLALFLDTLI